MKKMLASLVGLGFMAILICALVWAITSCFSWFASLQSDVAIALVAASVTIISSTAAIVLGRYFESIKEREAAHRDKKVVLYDELTSRLFKSFHSDESDNQNDGVSAEFLREIQRKLILWAGPHTVASYANWHRMLTTSQANPKAETMIGMVDFFLSLRQDLGLSNKGISREQILRFMLKESDLFMQMYRANKDVLFSEIAGAEEQIKKIDRQQPAAGNAL